MRVSLVDLLISRMLTTSSSDGELTDEMKMKWTPCSPGIRRRGRRGELGGVLGIGGAMTLRLHVWEL